jgi:hypothetical protein
MSIDTKNIRADPYFINFAGKSNTMVNGPMWVDPTVALIKASRAEKGRVLPLYWALKGTYSSSFEEIVVTLEKAISGNTVEKKAWDTSVSDGYQVWGALLWDRPEEAGTMGACVEALD